MKRLNITFGTILFVLSRFAFSPASQAQSLSPAPTIVTFNVPGAGTGPFQGTIVTAVNATGDIVGYYVDASDGAHGFVRAKNGTFTTFNVPGDAFTLAYSINPVGSVTGLYGDPATGLRRGYLRSKHGTFTTFDAPGVGPYGTFSSNINPAGTIAGDFGDANNVHHGFVRASNGSFTTFDAPGAGTGLDQGTGVATTTGLNPAGVVAGGYLDGNFVSHGFVRAANGMITTFNAPGAGTDAFQGTDSISINAAGNILGVYLDANNAYHGFLRTANGILTTFDVPGAGTGPYQGTNPYMIGATGEITGLYTDANNKNHGFTLTPHGAFISFDAPSASTSDFTGTIAVGNTPAGQVVGYYIDDNFAFHGFVLSK